MSSPQERIDRQRAEARKWKRRRGAALAVLMLVALAALILSLAGSMPGPLAVAAAIVTIGAAGTVGYSWRKVRRHTPTPEYVDLLHATQNPPPVSGREVRDRMRYSTEEG